MIARFHPLRLLADATCVVNDCVGGKLAGAAANVVVLLYKSIDGLKLDKRNEPKQPGTNAPTANTCSASTTSK